MKIERQQIADDSALKSADSDCKSSFSSAEGVLQDYEDHEFKAKERVSAAQQKLENIVSSLRHITPVAQIS